MKKIHFRIPIDRRIAVLTAVLIVCIAFSIVYVAYATAPNPGHNFTEVSGGAAQGDLFYGSAVDTLSALAKNTTATRYLANTGTSNNPQWDLINLANGITGVLPVTNGGTGWVNLQANTVLLGNGGGAVATTSAGTNGFHLALVGGVPTWIATTTNSCSSGITCSFAGGASSFSIGSNALILAMFPQIAAATVIGNGTGGTATPTAVATSSLFGVGTNGFILAESGGVPTWVSTSTVASGTLVGRQVLTSGTTYTPTSGTNTVVLQMVAGGGGGGGATGASTPTTSVGGGGGSGSYAEKRFAGIAGAASYVVAIGAGGLAGVAANGTGGTGGITTFACPSTCTGGALTVTANGGLGGVTTAAGTTILSSMGGAGAAVSTNGDVNSNGQAGEYAVRFSGSTGIAGSGAPSFFGGGAKGSNAAGAGTTAVGFGGGGSGAVSFNATAVAGGAGAPGVLVIWEFR